MFNGTELCDLKVLHRCDNPSCVNPNHLFLGTIKDNNDDKMRKGRHNCGRGLRHGTKTKPEKIPRGDANGARTKPEKIPRGQNRPNSKLKDTDILEIFSLKQKGLSDLKIAFIKNVSRVTIQNIISRKKWKHINLTNLQKKQED